MNTSSCFIKGNMILAAVSRVESVDSVGLYAIMLAKRTGMSVCLLLVLNEREGNFPASGNGNGIREKMRLIKEAGAHEDIRVDCLIASSVFKEEVLRYLKEFDTSILVVGEGNDRKMRCEELREIEKELVNDSDWHRNRSHHFLIVSKKSEVLTIDNNDLSIECNFSN